MAKAKRAVAPRKKPEQVAEYFVRVLGEGHPGIAQWRGLDIPVDSTCGDDCKRAIDAAALLIERVRMARGEDGGGQVQEIMDIAEDCCGIYILG